MTSPPLAQIGKVYGLTRQRIHHLVRKEGLPLEVLMNPDEFFRARLEGNRSRFRERLANPSTRARIAETLHNLTSNI